MIHFHIGMTVCENEDCIIHQCDGCFRFFGLTNTEDLPLHNTTYDSTLRCNGNPSPVE